MAKKLHTVSYTCGHKFVVVSRREGAPSSSPHPCGTCSEEQRPSKPNRFGRVLVPSYDDGTLRFRGEEEY